MKNVIFTICAKNYLAQARVLGYSVKKNHPNCDFYIVLSDEIDNENLNCDDFKIIEAKEIGIDNYYDLAFKYDVIEFSTAIKPYFIKYLFEFYTNVIYLDPDMVVFNSLQFLFDELINFDALLTPHLVKPYIKFEGATSEETILWVGIFNLGFFAIKNSITGNLITDWWMEKLRDQCYADKEDGLHVDQKWMDFLPSLYQGSVYILNNPAINIAFWNFHERKLFKQDEKYFVDDIKYPLTIFHFSSFNPDNVDTVAGRQNKFTLSTIPEYKEIYYNYLRDLNLNGLDVYRKMEYKYNQFENGIPILKLHRRLYRGLIKDGYKFNNQFSTNSGTYYSLLEENHIKLYDKGGKFKVLKKTYGENPPIFKIIFNGLILFNKVFGTSKYYLMMRFFSIFHRFENQTFLIKKK